GIHLDHPNRRKTGCASSRSAASRAPAKFGMRPWGGNGNRATFFACSRSQTALRAAALSPKRIEFCTKYLIIPSETTANNYVLSMWVDEVKTSARVFMEV